MIPRIHPMGWLGRLGLLVLGLGLLLAGAPQAQEQSGLGYWKLAGPAEFWVSKLPPKGPARHSHSGGMQTTYQVAEGKVRFINAWPPGKALVVGEVTWAPPPAAIHPGEVVDVAGTAALLEFETAGLGFGAEFGLICQFGPKAPERAGQDPGLTTGLMLLGMEKGSTLKARSHPVGGVPARRKVEYRNTDCVFGQKGQRFSGSGAPAELYLVYTASGGGYSPRVAYRYVWAPMKPTSSTASVPTQRYATPVDFMRGIWLQEADARPDGRLVSAEAPYPTEFTPVGGNRLTGRYVTGLYGTYTVEISGSAPGTAIVFHYSDRAAGNYSAVYTGRIVNENVIEGSYKDSRKGGGEFRFTRKR